MSKSELPHQSAVQCVYAVYAIVVVGFGAFYGRGRIGVGVGVILEIAEAIVPVVEIERATCIAPPEGERKKGGIRSPWLPVPPSSALSAAAVVAKTDKWVNG